MTSIKRYLSLLFVMLTALTKGQELQKPSAPPLAVQSTTDFEITGDAASAHWSKADWTSLSLRQGTMGAYQSRFKLLYSQKGVYCLFHCQDKKITSTLREDFANLFKEDVVEIFFWPNEAIPVYFEYELSPYGYELPIIVPNIDGNAQGWRPWHYEGEKVTRRMASIQKTDNGVESWTAEFFIPYSLLRPLVTTPPQKGNRWRVNMYRIDYDEGTTQWTWRPVGKNFHDFKNFGTMEFH